MTKDEALRLALEALEHTESRFHTIAWGREQDAITAIKAALEANDEKDGSPCPEFWDWLPKAYRNGDADDLPKFTKYNMEVSFLAGKQSAALEAKDESWTPDDTAYRPNGLPQDFIKHEVESLEDWSEWVCPNPDEYFMKCCDCGLVHEVQYRVARYGEGDYCELVEDKDVQAQFRMRRRTPPQQEAKDDPVAWLKVSETLGGFGKFVEAKPNEKGAKPVYTTQPQRTWVGLTLEEVQDSYNADYQAQTRAIEAKLKEKNYD